MTKYFLFLLLQTICINSYSQKMYSLGIDGVFYRSLTSDNNKQSFFSKDFGLQISYRKKIIDYNYLSLIMGATNSNHSIYNSQFFRFGFEAGEIFGVKNLFVLPEIVVKRYSLKALSKSSFSVAPSIGFGYNLKINKNLLLRSYNNFEYNIPSKIGSSFNNLCFGIHYLFD